MKKNWRLAGCAVLLGAVFAFPAGMMFAGDRLQNDRPTASAAKGASAPRRAARDFYSPDILNDPYVVEQQIRVVEALELSCRQLNELCREAKQARQRMEQQTSD